MRFLKYLLLFAFLPITLPLLAVSSVREFFFSDGTKLSRLDSKEHKLAEKEQELETKEHEFSDKERQLQTREHEFSDKERQLQTKEHGLTDKERRLENKERELANKERELESKQSGLAKKEYHLILHETKRQLAQSSDDHELIEEGRGALIKAKTREPFHLPHALIASSLVMSLVNQGENTGMAWLAFLSFLLMLKRYTALQLMPSLYTQSFFPEEKKSPVVSRQLLEYSSAELTQQESVLAEQDSDDAKKIVFLAASRGYLETMKDMLSNGADINATNKEGNTALMAAASNGRLSVARELIAKGAQVNTRNKKGYTALMCAAENGHSDVVNELLGQRTGYFKNWALGVARFFGRSANHCTNHLSKMMDDSLMALILAAKNGHVDVIRELLKLKTINLNIQDSSGCTALMQAAQNGHIDVVLELIKAHSLDDLAALEIEEDTLFAWATKSGHSEVLAALREKATDCAFPR